MTPAQPQPVPSGTPLVLFFHGNSFPASTYSVMLNALRERGMQVQALEKIGHNPAYPVTSNWPHLVEEVHAFTQPLIAAHTGPVVLVSHSLGGMLSLMLAAQYPPFGASCCDGGCASGRWLASQSIAIVQKTFFESKVFAGCDQPNAAQ